MGLYEGGPVRMCTTNTTQQYHFVVRPSTLQKRIRFCFGRAISQLVASSSTRRDEILRWSEYFVHTVAFMSTNDWTGQPIPWQMSWYVNRLPLPVAVQTHDIILVLVRIV